MNTQILSLFFSLAPSLFFTTSKQDDFNNVPSVPSTLFGATSGGFSVSGAGTGAYAIPIIFPFGMQPFISLFNSCYGGNGPRGLVW